MRQISIICYVTLSLFLLVRCGEDNPPVADLNLAEEETCARLKSGLPKTIYPHIDQFLLTLPKETCTEFEDCHEENLMLVRNWLFDFECIHQANFSDSVFVGGKYPQRELAIEYDSDTDITSATLLFDLRDALTYAGVKE